jgi:hypothetical protein
MKVKQRKPYMISSFGITAVLAAMIIFTPPVFSLGCTVESLIPVQSEPYDVGEFDGNMTCANWPTMVTPTNKCYLDLQKEGDQDSCQIETSLGIITVTGEKVGGWISWTSSAPVPGLGINKVILDNAQGANGCLQNSMYDVTSGEIAFVTEDNDGNVKTQPSGGAEFCADALVTEVPPAPPEPTVVEPLHQCQVARELPSDTLLPGDLDETGIVCPVYESQSDCDAAYAAAESAGKDVTDFECIPGVTQKPVVICNLEKDKDDWGTTDGSDICCQCGIPADEQVACEVTDDPTDEKCEQSMTVNPTQSVELMFFKDDVDPCTWIKTSKGWQQYCY